MFRKYFDLENPIEDYLNEAMTAYAPQTADRDLLLAKMAVDFPLAEEAEWSKVEKAAVLHYREHADRRMQKDDPVSVGWIRIFTENEEYEPENSWQSRQFHKTDGPDIGIAVHFINERFGLDSVRGKFSLYAASMEPFDEIHIEDFNIDLEKDQIAVTRKFSVEADNLILSTMKVTEIYAVIRQQDSDDTLMSKCFEYINSDRKPSFKLKYWHTADGGTELKFKSFNLTCTQRITTEIEVEASTAPMTETLEGKIFIDHSNAYRKTFIRDVTFSRIGGKRYKASLPLVALNYKNAGSLRNMTPVYYWGCGTFSMTLIVCGEIIGDKTINFHDHETLDPEVFKLIEDMNLEEMTGSQEETEEEMTDIDNVLRLNKFAFYHLFEKDEDDLEKILNVSDAQCRTTFKQDLLSVISVHAVYSIVDKNIDLARLEDDFTYTLYDETGRVIERKNALTFRSDLLFFVCVGMGRFTSYHWEIGRYRIELSFREECIATASFEVGYRAIDGEYDVSHIINNTRNSNKEPVSRDALNSLMEMIGLEAVKEMVIQKKNMSRFASQRAAAGLPVKQINLHAVFIGNPGTGKTTVARLLGQIYKEMGLLSKGHVVFEERKTLLGRYYDSESKAVSDAVERAQGGILFIDEAYNLFVNGDDKDPGNRIIEYLLTELSDESKRDWMLVLAGYPDKMNEMLNHNIGLKSRICDEFLFKDYDSEQLIEIADLYCRRMQFRLTDEAHKHLKSVIQREYSIRDDSFGNARFVNDLMDRIVNINMAARLSTVTEPNDIQLRLIEASDIPSMNKAEKSDSYKELHDMVGLEGIKKNIESHLNFVRMLNMRMQKGLSNEIPPLHMIFTGNPGTGKTTVADFMGEIYASMGILSKGDVIYAERSDLVGQYQGETELKVRNVINRAKGNVLFIDEAYQLFNGDRKDYGKIAMDTLLTTLSKDNIDMIVILAGYSKEMEELLKMNSGINSRFPYTFHFEDYSVNELIEIAVQSVKKMNYTFTDEALEKLRRITEEEVERKDKTFGNARFIKRLVTNKILPNLANRIVKMNNPDETALKTITVEDVPDNAGMSSHGNDFDEKAIDSALKELDAIVGQEKVKSAIRNFVDVARYLHSKGERFTGKGILKWNFTGNTGTGKSTVAGIMAAILKAMNLIESSEITEIKGEEIFNVSEYQCNEVLKNALDKSRDGMLFIDGDAPEFRSGNYQLTNEQLRIKLSSMTARNGGVGAIVIAENASPRRSIANSLAINGIYDYDHTFIFEDYKPEELYEILTRCLNKYHIGFSYDAGSVMKKYIADMCENKETGFANARTMKLLARTIHDTVILRLSRQENPTAERIVLAEDVKSFVWKKIYSKIGF